MMDLTSAAQVVAIVALALVVATYVHYVVMGASKNRLMRCPETGAVAFVGAERVSRHDGGAPKLAVQACEFWPKRQGCARGCLARYDETTSGYRVNREALRPFERR
jgi:hypothetical protein